MLSVFAIVFIASLIYFMTISAHTLPAAFSDEIIFEPYFTTETLLVRLMAES